MSSVEMQASRAADVARIGTRAFRLSAIFFALYLLSMPIYCLVRLSGEQSLIGPSTAFTAISLFTFSLAHCIETRGPGRSILMLFASFAIALTTEYLGSTYGLVFGQYYYTDNLGPKVLGKVPVIIPIAWFMMLYPAWSVADLLVMRWTKRDVRHTANNGQLSSAVTAIVRIAIAALAMTAWDLSLDPRMVADGNWIWPDGGAYFGIPLSNYAGWFITSALIYCAWQLIGAASPSSVLPSLIGKSTTFSLLDTRLLPIWAYIVTWIGESLANAIFWGGPAVAVAVFIGMGLFGAPALWIVLHAVRRAPHVA